MKMLYRCVSGSPDWLGLMSPTLFVCARACVCVNLSLLINIVTLPLHHKCFWWRTQSYCAARCCSKTASNKRRTLKKMPSLIYALIISSL